MTTIDGRETILLLTSRIGMGGAERHMITLSNLLNRDFRIVFAYLKPEEDMLGQLEQDALAEVRCLHVAKRVDMRAVRELAEMVKTHGASMIVCANAFALFYAQLARPMCRPAISVVEIFHTTKLRTLKEHLELVFYRPFFWAAHHLVFVCQEQQKYWRKRGLWARSNHMIYNGVDLRRYVPEDEEAAPAERSRALAGAGFTSEDRIIGLCAVLRPEKAHADLLRAVATLHAKGQKWKILFIGDGPLRESIEATARELGLADSMVITGFQLDVRPFIAACDVIALPSVSETFSIAALEAMAMGKPMIMSDVGGAREQIRPGENGLLFPAGDVEMFAECVAQFWDRDFTSRLGAAARRRVQQDFSQSSMIDRYKELFDSIIRKGRTGARVA